MLKKLKFITGQNNPNTKFTIIKVGPFISRYQDTGKTKNPVPVYRYVIKSAC